MDILQFEIAKEKNNQTGYENYIKEFPRGDYVSIAKEKIEEFEYLSMNKERSLISCYFFIKKYPNSKYKNQARNLRETLRYEEACMGDSIKSYSHYIIEFPLGLFSLDAKKRRDALLSESAWTENSKDTFLYKSACKENSINSFSHYLDEFPKGIFSVNAKSKKDSLIKSLDVLTEVEVTLLVKEISDILNPFSYLELYNDCVNKSGIDKDSYFNGSQYQVITRSGISAGGGDYQETIVKGSNGFDCGFSTNGGYLEFYMQLNGKDLVIRSRYYDDNKKLSTYTITSVGELINVFQIQVPLSVKDFIDSSGGNAKTKLPNIKKVRVLELSKPNRTYTEGNINFTHINFYDQNGEIKKSYYAIYGKVYKN